MPQAPVTLHLETLNRLAGRLLAIHDSGLLPAEDAQACHDAALKIDIIVEALELIAKSLAPPDLPEASRSSHYSG
jgi:hypothetical protein